MVTTDFVFKYLIDFLSLIADTMSVLYFCTLFVLVS